MLDLEKDRTKMKRMVIRRDRELVGFISSFLVIGAGIIAPLGSGSPGDRLHFHDRSINGRFPWLNRDLITLAGPYSISWPAIGGESPAAERVMPRGER